ncbi:MAG: hypothetical protein LBB38_03845 [Puniceicoccales bacterium]|jgi:hypothetical protein|nr:hypothetical protein [Puniceicoccales bacterium]
MKNLLLTAGAIPPLVIGLLAFWNPFRLETMLRLIRNPFMDGLLFVSAAGAFLWKIVSLGEADFGNFRPMLFCVFALISLAMLARNYGFLSVRGLAVLQLLWANELLKAGLGHYSLAWIVAKLFTYICILFAIYFVARPYRMRDLLCRRARR